MTTNWVTIAVLGRTHANRGEITAFSTTSKPERFQNLRQAFLFGESEEPHPVEIESVWEHGNHLVFKFRHMDSISDAEIWQGAEMRVPASDRVPLEEGEFFYSDLIGCEVWDRKRGDRLGIVTAVQEFGGPGLLELDNGMLVPYAKAICVNIDPAAHRIDVDLPEGLRRIEPAVNFHILTIFPEFFDGPFRHGVVARGVASGTLRIHIHNLRDWTHDRHKTVDDRPFGGAEGMVLKPEPIFQAVESIWPERPLDSKIILLSAQGRKFEQSLARELSAAGSLLFLCGRYEGVDERVAEHLAEEEISIGDYVLSGGELAAMVIIDAVARLIPGVVGNSDSTAFESFESGGHREGLLDCPQYTRPADFRGWKVPEVLLSGNHEEIRKWRKAAAREKTAKLRPDLLR